MVAVLMQLNCLPGIFPFSSGIGSGIDNGRWSADAPFAHADAAFEEAS
jgi:hypothetical protein